MGYVLVKGNGAPATAAPVMNAGGGGGMSVGYMMQPNNMTEDHYENIRQERGPEAEASARKWARLGRMAAYAGAAYGGLNALNESLASGHGGGLLSDVGMGAYGGYATASPLEGWLGQGAAGRYPMMSEEEEENQTVPPTGENSGQMSIDDFAPGARARAAVTGYTPSPIADPTGISHPEIVDELNQQRDTYY